MFAFLKRQNKIIVISSGKQWWFALQAQWGKVALYHLFKRRIVKVLHPCVVELKEHGFRDGPTCISTLHLPLIRSVTLCWLRSHSEPQFFYL